MKLDRLLAITMALLNQTRVSATELAERFEVSLRTIYRDMESINLAGIPIISFPGSDGGYEILSGYRVDKQILSIDDFSSICGALRGAKTATNNADIDGLLERIGALMPNKPGSFDSSVSLDFSPSPSDKEKIKPLHQAIKELRLVRFEYWDFKGKESLRTIEPMGLFLKGYAWYIYGYCLDRNDFRVFRLSRMADPVVLAEKFVRRDYTLQDVERQFMSKADFNRVGATLRFDPAIRTRVRDEFGFDKLTINADGTIDVEAKYSSKERAIQNILSYGVNVQVLEPPEIQEELRIIVTEMLSHYS
ncbi:putative DNA-binding transcriptional regulator YafY [Cohnella lupini]|uniref:Putative DNA-binding transcriptional regulator YafY n=1 Tax=Cohnella lupini TaxID=1294267 RepID=A0A3D9IKV9_9BACL|nr:putative DNA-binding transcriptional regulator YafY [Cohnella lupini]